MTEPIDETHELAQRGPNRVTYVLARLLAAMIVRVLFLARVTGSENIPADGPVVITPNHKSFWDGAIIAAMSPRPVRFMAKSELFDGPLRGLMLALGAFPVRRGQGDGEAIRTAVDILTNGDALVLFPEGTRVRDPEQLGTPRRGAVRIAIEAGAPLVPAAISGSEKRRLPLPRRIRVTFGTPIVVTATEATPEAAGSVMTDQVWPEVEDQYVRLRSAPGLIAASAAAIGVGYLLRRRRR